MNSRTLSAQHDFRLHVCLLITIIQKLIGLKEGTARSLSFPQRNVIRLLFQE